MGFEVSYKDESHEKLERDPEYHGGYSKAIVKAFRKRMWAIRNATDERDLFAMKSVRFERLKGNRKHQHSMRLNDQWRLILELKEEGNTKKIIIINIEDYH